MLIFATLQLMALAEAADSFMVNGWVVRISILPVTFIKFKVTRIPGYNEEKRAAALLSWVLRTHVSS